jgi:hypothetical protein
VVKLEDGEEGRQWILEMSGMAQHATWEDKHRSQGWKSRSEYRYSTYYTRAVCRQTYEYIGRFPLGTKSIDAI